MSEAKAAATTDDEWDSEAIVAGIDFDEDEGEGEGAGAAEEEESPPADAEPADTDDSPPAEEATDEPDDDAPPAAQTAPAADSEEGDDGPEAVPFVAKFDKQELAVDGAYEVGDLIVIPKEAFQRQIRPHLGDRHAWMRTEKALKAEVARLQGEKGEKESLADSLVEEITRLTSPGNEAELMEFLNDMERQGPILQANAKAAAAEKRLRDIEAREQERYREEEEAELPQVMEASVSDWVDRLAAGHPDLQGVELDTASLKRELLGLKEKVFIRADRDYPDAGVKKGDLAVDTDLVFALMRQEAQAQKRIAARLKERTAAAATNAKATGSTRRPAPPAVGARGDAVPTGKRSAEPTNAAEYKKWLMENDD
jgi:hypothetical protein